MQIKLIGEIGSTDDDTLFFCSANKNLLGHPVLCVYYTAWLFTDWHLHLNSREKGVGFSLFFWLFWWSCVSSSSISANCAYCASFSNRAAAASRSSFLLLFSSLEAHARGQKGQLSRKPSQTQQIKNWATRWETYFHSVFYITLGSTGCPSKNIYIFF